MIKWTLNRGTGENLLAASGRRYYSGLHTTFTITGTTGPLEGDKVGVNLKMTYASTWLDISMKGHFDPEENSLRGTMTISDGTSGEFVFKRNPEFVRLYPAPSTVDAKARWKFATTVILDRIRRDSWSPSYILKRIKDGKRYMQLAIRDEYYGKELDDDESDEYSNLLSSFYEIDARFYASLIRIKLSKVIIQCVDSFLQGFWMPLTQMNAVTTTVIPVMLPSEDRESFVWIVTTRQQ